MSEHQTEHAWFHEQMAAYLAGGLDEQQRQRVKAHAGECAQCAADLEQLRKEDQAMQAAFAGSIPGADFEDRIIASLRHRWTDRLIIHPAVRKAAAAVAALIILGTAGYTANTLMNRGGLPSLVRRDESGALAFGLPVSLLDGRFTAPSGSAEKDTLRAPSASNLRQIGQAVSIEGVPSQSQIPPTDQAALVKEARGYIAQNKYSDALAAVDRILDVDGDNDYARAVRPLVEDRARKQAGGEVNDRAGGRQAGADEKKVPYTDIYRYPASWFETNEGRDHSMSLGEAAGDRPAGGPEVAKLGVTAGKFNINSSAFKPAEWEALAKTSGDTRFYAQGQKPVDAKDSITLPWDDEVDAKRADKGKIAAGFAKPQAEALAEGKQGGQSQAAPQANTPVQAAADNLSRKIIRTGQMEFEVDSFDSAFAQVSKIVGEEGGFVASTDSQKLPNGKMTGSITLRVAPERLDTLVLKLRALGELKSQKIAAQDITKQYTDLESQLRAARAMEGRLLEIIKTGQGQIKDLVAAEKELGVWREKIERVEGEIRYYNNQVALSTLTIALSEKDVKAAAFASETETRNLGIETEDVEASYAAAQQLVSEHKGRIVSAVLKKLEAQQMAANITCEVAPDNAGALTDRLKQLGNVVRLESDRKTTTADGTEPKLNSRVERKDTRFIISLYNLANIAPRQTTSLTIAGRNVEQTYAAILARVSKSTGRVVNSNLSQLKADQTAATINFQVKAADADAVLSDLRTSIPDVEVLRLTSTENPDTANVSAAKRGFSIQIVSLAAIAPRETISLQLAVPAVPEAHRTISDLLGSETVKARVLTAQLSKRDSQHVSGTLDFEVRRSDLPAIESALATAGDVFGRSSQRAAETENTTDSKVRLTLGIVNAGDVAPRESVNVTVEVGDVEKVLGDLSAAALSYGGRSIDSRLSHEPSGRVTGSLAIDVPLARGPEIIKTIREQGTIKAIDTQKNSQVPEGKLTRARIDLTISNGEGLVAGDRGVWASIRNALGTSVAGLLWSLQLIVIGLFLIVPWAVALWAAAKLLRRLRRSRTAA